MKEVAVEWPIIWSAGLKATIKMFKVFFTKTVTANIYWI